MKGTEGAYVAWTDWEDLLIDFVLGKEMKAGVERGVEEVGENRVSSC